jgi:hypothetical protein
MLRYIISNMKTDSGKRFWTKTDIANYYGVTSACVNQWIVKYSKSTCPFPSPILSIGHSRKYVAAQVKRWIADPLKDI